MGTLSSPSGCPEATLDVQVLQGLETYITTEKFLHTLEAASAEWIDLSDHQQHPHKGWSPPCSSSELELQQVQQPSSSHKLEARCRQAQQPSTTSTGGSFFGRWRRSSSNAADTTTNNSSSSAVTSSGAEALGSSGTTASTSISSAPSSSADSAPAVVAATTRSAFELVERQPPLTESLMQEPFVLVSSEDAIEGMAYYIALYLSRAPEARYMEPKQLQAALRQTMTAIRRSRYRAIWDWGRCLYRWGAVSYSALQLYEHPWLVRAVVAGVWASSKMAFGVLF